MGPIRHQFTLEKVVSRTDLRGSMAVLVRTLNTPLARVRSLCSSTAAALLQNQFATGGLAVLAGGAGLAALRSLANVAFDAVLRRLVLRAEFDSRDDSYRWLTAWLADHPHFQTTRRFSVVTTLRRLGASSIEDDGQGSGQGGVILLPLGTAIMRHKHSWLIVARERHTDTRPTDTGKERETLTFHIPGGTKHDLLELVEEARTAFEARQRGWTSIYHMDEYGSWGRVGAKPSRPASSVILHDATQVATLLEDTRRFLRSAQWYASRGIPYRRGYLLHGPPGTGKTSLVTALAGELGLPIYAASLASARLSDDTFAEALGSAAPRCLLLLEDVDAAFVQRESQTAGGTGLSFSGLLNALDGVAAQEGRLLFLTTNHPERLDAALVRPGRVDVRLAFRLCTVDHVLSYARHFYHEWGELGVDIERKLTACIPPETVSVAELQGALMQHPDSPSHAVEVCRKLFAERAPVVR